MKEKSFMVVMLVAIVSLGLVGYANPQQKVITWKIQGSDMPGMLYHDTLLMFAKRVQDASGGRLKLQVYPGGSMCGPFEGLKAVSDGLFEVNYATSGFWVGKIPAAPLFCSIPGGFNDIDMYMWMKYGGGEELYQEMYDRYGFKVKVFLAMINTIQNFQWAKKPLRTLEDMKGVRMRMMPLMGDILKKHGMAVAFMPPAEIIPNLERGVIDGAEFASSAYDYSAHFHEVCKYYMVPGVHQPSATGEAIVNKDAWEALPDDLKAVWKNACEAHLFEAWAYETQKTMEAEKEFKKHGNVKIAMDPKTVATLTKWSADYLDERAEKDEFFGKVRESQKAFEKIWYPHRNLAVVPHPTPSGEWKP